MKLCTFIEVLMKTPILVFRLFFALDFPCFCVRQKRSTQDEHEMLDFHTTLRLFA